MSDRLSVEKHCELLDSNMRDKIASKEDDGRDDSSGSGGGGGTGTGGPTDVDPIIRGLLARLPPSGDVWPETERTLWLQLLEGSFKLIYKDKPATTTE